MIRAMLSTELGADMAPFKRLIKDLAVDIMTSVTATEEPEEPEEVVDPEEDFNDDFDDDDDDDASASLGEEEDVEEEETKAQKKRVRTKKKKKKRKSKGVEKKAALGSASIARAKTVLKEASIRVPPRLYAVHKTEAALESALLDLLSKEGLSSSSTRKEIAKVRKRLEMQRDLDGIDISNIVDTGRRRLRH